MKRRLFPALLLIMLCLGTAMPAPAQAFDPFGRDSGSVDCSDSKQKQSTVCSTPNDDPLTGPHGIFVKLTNIVAIAAGALAVIMIIVGCIRFITSGSDLSTNSRTDTDVEDAKSTIVSALVGLVVIVLAQAIITFVVRRL